MNGPSHRLAYKVLVWLTLLIAWAIDTVRRK
jgi:hypothetical protein